MDMRVIRVCLSWHVDRSQNGPQILLEHQIGNASAQMLRAHLRITKGLKQGYSEVLHHQNIAFPRAAGDHAFNYTERELVGRKKRANFDHIP